MSILLKKSRQRSAPWIQGKATFWLASKLDGAIPFTADLTGEEGWLLQVKQSPKSNYQLCCADTQGVCLVSGLLPCYSYTLLIHGTFTFSNFTLLSFRERQTGYLATLSELSRNHVKSSVILSYSASSLCLHIFTDPSFPPHCSITSCSHCFQSPCPKF